jgi:hypothetical protein
MLQEIYNFAFISWGQISHRFTLQVKFVPHMNYEYTKNSNVYEASIPAHGNYAQLANSICGLKRKSQTGCLLLTRGRATPKRNPTAQKLLPKPQATDLKQETGGFLYIMEIRNINDFMP